MTAYYSRNRSYSRSYNAESAEMDERFPRTRAARHLGLSVKAFDNGVRNCGYATTEWHHVGKYANEVDYYDTKELADNFRFWMGARNKRNSPICNENIRRIARESMLDRLNARADRVRYSGFLAKVEEMVAGKYARQKLYALGGVRSFMSGKPCVSVAYGSHMEYCQGFMNIEVFELSKENIKRRINDYKAKKLKFHREVLERKSKIRYSFDPENVVKIIKRWRDGLRHCNSLSECGYADYLAAAKILKKTKGWHYRDDGRRVTCITDPEHVETAREKSERLLTRYVKECRTEWMTEKEIERAETFIRDVKSRESHMEKYYPDELERPAASVFKGLLHGFETYMDSLRSKAEKRKATPDWYLNNKVNCI